MPCISIHAPRVGSDCSSMRQRFDQSHFNPRSPCGERPFGFHLIGAVTKISIHAPRVGSDRIACCSSRFGCYFNPRSPCGERPKEDPSAHDHEQFQSTLPVWGATAKMHRFFFCIFGKNGIFCDILQIGRHLQGIGRKRRGDFLSRSVRTSRGKYGYLAFAFRESGGLRENRRFYSQSVLFSFRIDCQGSRIEGCPFRGP